MRAPQVPGANARRFGHDATAWMDTLWDPEQRLLRAGRSQAGHTHMIRETSWYAAGLLAVTCAPRRPAADKPLRVRLAFHHGHDDEARRTRRG